MRSVDREEACDGDNIAYHLPERTASHYNSLHRSSVSTSCVINAFLEHLNLEGDPWEIQNAPGPYQENDYDCGVFVLMTALSIILAGRKPPDATAFVDVDFWRCCLRNFIAGKSNDHVQEDSDALLEAL